jgi:L-aminopeptidase/D-esterase-like protein
LVGAGRGATVGKLLGINLSSPGGIGAAQVELDGVVVGAIMAVNALGHVVEPRTNQIVAGARHADGSWIDTVDQILLGSAAPPTSSNTTIGVIWTNAALDKQGCNRIAEVAHNGLARTIRPAHTQYDGDTLFVLALSQEHAGSADWTRLGVAATEAVARAVVRAVTAGHLDA